jgi:hypothetical protein
MSFQATVLFYRGGRGDTRRRQRIIQNETVLPFSAVFACSAVKDFLLNARTPI